MDTIKLKKIIDCFKSGNIDENPNFVSLLIVEQVLKKKSLELEQIRSEYERHISKLFGLNNCKIDLNDYGLVNISYNELLTNKLKSFYISGTITDFNVGGYDVSDKKEIYLKKILNKDEETIDFFKNYYSWLKKYNIGHYNLLNNLGLHLYIRQSSDEGLKILISDEDFGFYEYSGNKPLYFSFPEDFNKSHPTMLNLKFSFKPRGKFNFYYIKDIFNNKKFIHFYNDEAIDFINEELIGKIYACLKVDVSSFDKELQEEFKRQELINQTNLQEAQAKEIDDLRKLQVDRIIKAYALFKEAIELLNNAKMDMKFDRIKIDNLNQIIFKNGRLPNNHGFIEFEEFFKNNMILRMIDLSALDLTNVDIRGLDFSGTNIHINPQIIYNKDMTNVNATDVKFSPFLDSFDNVILDGTIINDWEAMINLSTIKSYNEKTSIKKEVVKYIGR